MIKYLSSESLKKFSGKTCLLRVDLNVEIGMPLDSYRLEAILPTVQLLLKNNVRVILMSHRGRPALKSEGQARGVRDDWDFDKGNRELRLAPFAKLLAKKINESVCLISYEKSFTLDKKGFLAGCKERVFLLENLRFYRGEETNDDRFGEFLSTWGNFYVNDAFAVSHRANASVAAVTKFLPSYAGLLMEKEIKNLDKAMKSKNHPFTVVIGGAKVSDKLGVVKYFWKKADNFLVGGSPANTFLQAEGMDVGDSLVDAAAKPLIAPYLNAKKIHLPADVKYRSTKILDIGPKTVKEYAAIIEKSKTIIWNGPMGWFERKGFGNGTRGLWKAILANKKAHIVVGGGETVTSLKTLFPKPHPLSSNLFLSTGGGAMLMYLSGEKLPGIEALK